MLTIYKIQMDSKIGYWEATCGIDGQEFTVHASAWIDSETNSLVITQNSGGSRGIGITESHWAEVRKAIREAIVARWSVSQTGHCDGFNTGGCDNARTEL